MRCSHTSHSSQAFMDQFWRASQFWLGKSVRNSVMAIEMATICAISMNLFEENITPLSTQALLLVSKAILPQGILESSFQIRLKSDKSREAGIFKHANIQAFSSGRVFASHCPSTLPETAFWICTNTMAGHTPHTTDLCCWNVPNMQVVTFPNFPPEIVR